MCGCKKIYLKCVFSSQTNLAIKQSCRAGSLLNKQRDLHSSKLFQKNRYISESLSSTWTQGNQFLNNYVHQHTWEITEIALSNTKISVLYLRIYANQLFPSPIILAFHYRNALKPFISKSANFIWHKGY